MEVNQTDGLKWCCWLQVWGCHKNQPKIHLLTYYSCCVTTSLTVWTHLSDIHVEHSKKDEIVPIRLDFSEWNVNSPDFNVAFIRIRSHSVMKTVGLERLVFLFTWWTKMLPDVVHYPDIRLPPVMWKWPVLTTDIRQPEEMKKVSPHSYSVVLLQTELTDLLSSVWFGFDLLCIWRWTDMIFEFGPQGEVTAQNQSVHWGMAPAPTQTSTSRHHLPSN